MLSESHIEKRSNKRPGAYINGRFNDESIPFWALLKIKLLNGKLGLENTVLQFFTWLLYKKPGNPQKILVFRTGSLGDSINAIPALQAIRDTYPNAQIDILTNAGLKNLVGMPYLIQRDLYNEMVDYFGMPKFQLFKMLRARNYDMVIQLPQANAIFRNLMRDLIIFRFIAKQGIGWFTSHTFKFKKTQAKYILYINEHERLLNFLRKHNFVINNLTPTLTPSDADIKFVKEQLLKQDVPAERKKIAVVVGAKRPQNRWPVENFKTVIEKFSATTNILLIGSAEDQLLAQPLLQLPGVYSFCGILTPMQSAALFSLCDLTLSNDTGPMHMSYAVHTLTIALFSARDLPGKWYPPSENNVVFRAKNIDCKACNDDSNYDNVCMTTIRPEEVIRAIDSFLNKKC